MRKVQSALLFLSVIIITVFLKLHSSEGKLTYDNALMQ